MCLTKNLLKKSLAFINSTNGSIYNLFAASLIGLLRDHAL